MEEGKVQKKKDSLVRLLLVATTATSTAAAAVAFTAAVAVASTSTSASASTSTAASTATAASALSLALLAFTLTGAVRVTGRTGAGAGGRTGARARGSSSRRRSSSSRSCTWNTSGGRLRNLLHLDVTVADVLFLLLLGLVRRSFLRAFLALHAGEERRNGLVLPDDVLAGNVWLRLVGDVLDVLTHASDLSVLASAEPVPRLLGNGTETLAPSAGGSARNVADEEISKPVLLTADLGSVTEVVTLDSVEGAARNVGEAWQDGDQAGHEDAEETSSDDVPQSGEDVRSTVVHKGAVLIVFIRQKLGHTAHSAACPAEEAVATVLGVARVTAARLAVVGSAVEELVSRVLPVTVRQQSSVTLVLDPLVFLLRVETSIGEDGDDGSKVSEEGEDGSSPEEAALGPRVLDGIDLHELLAISRERTAGAAEALEKETEVGTLAAARGAPALSIGILAKRVLFLHSVSKKDLALVEHVAARAAASGTVVRRLLEACLANVDVPVISHPLVRGQRINFVVDEFLGASVAIVGSFELFLFG